MLAMTNLAFVSQQTGHDMVVGHTPKHPQIPTGLRDEEMKIYEKAFEVLDERRRKRILPTNIVVISDLQKDVDDLAAWITLIELRRLGLVNLKGFVTNFVFEEKRARAGRGLLDLMHLRSVPVGVGTRGSDHEADLNRRIMPYEFDNCPYMAPKLTKFLTGFELLHQIFTDAQKNSDKLTVLLISSLRDMDQFIQTHPNLVHAVAEKFIIQGDFELSGEGVPEALAGAANNDFDLPAAKRVHKWAYENSIPMTAYTKYAAFATHIPDQLCKDMAASGHLVGKYLRESQVAMDLDFYRSACSEDPKGRFKEFMDQEWYLRYKTTYFKQHPHAPRSEWPVGEDVIQYINKLTAYDALAAVGAVGEDFLDKLEIRLQFEGQRSMYEVVGVPDVKADWSKGIAGREKNDGVDGKMMAWTIRAMMRGCMLALQQVLDDRRDG